VDRSNSSSYNIGQILRTDNPENCISPTDSACFLYQVVQGGNSSPGSANYCTTLGCESTDGNVRVKAVRGPYTFKRKLRTVPGGELITIPYATVDNSAPEARGCPSNFSSRKGIGINDET